MALDIMEIVVGIIAVIIAMYILSALGYAKHNSPIITYGRAGARAFSSRTMTRTPTVVNTTTGVATQPSVARASIGANELGSGRTLIRPI